MSVVAKVYTEEDVQKIINEAHERTRELMKAQEFKHEKLELDLTETKSKCIRLEKAYDEEKKRNAEIEAKFTELLKRYNIKKESSEQLLAKLKQHNEALTSKYNQLDKLKEANVEIAKEKQKHEHTEFALKAKNTMLEQQVKSLKSDYDRQSEELRAKGSILDELVEQLAPNAEC